MVTINYRLNAFGFLALPSLDGKHRSSGDYGLMDQQAAMRWVRGNARAFGGNGRHGVCAVQPLRRLPQVRLLGIHRSLRRRGTYPRGAVRASG